MPALFEVEGMVEDAHGTGLFRLAVVTVDEGTLPDVRTALGNQRVIIRSVVLKDNPFVYSPSKLKVSESVLILYDELKSKRYTRLSAIDGWRAEPKKRETKHEQGEHLGTSGRQQVLPEPGPVRE